jgi:uncharacterized membrane protein YeiH
MLRDPFQLPVFFDLGATFLFGVTGALAAIQRKYDLVGVFFLALATALGGALLRDSLFLQQGPPAFTKDGRYLLMIVTSVGCSLVFKNRVNTTSRPFALVDALGLGAYGIVGVQKSMAAELSIPAAILVGVLNACGGGVLRDILCREEPMVFKPGQFYVLAALGGGVMFVGLSVHLGLPGVRAAWISIATTFVLRWLTIQFNWRTTSLHDSSGIQI